MVAQLVETTITSVSAAVPETLTLEQPRVNTNNTNANTSNKSSAGVAPTPVTQLTPKPAVQTTTPTNSNVASGLPGRVDPACISSHIDRLGASDVDKQTASMQAMGVNWVRFDVTWAAIEQSKGSYNWTNYDYDVNAVLSRGMKPLAILTQYGLPSWERIDSSNWLSTPNNMGDFQTFANTFAQHYKGKIKLYEIGNEPNISQFWPNGPDAHAYTQFLQAGYKGVKAADSSAKVISGGLANISAVNFLQGMYNAGAKGYFDYVGFHPYSYPNGPDYTAGATSFSQIANIHQVMANYGQGTMQVMATEVGWPSTVISGGVDESTQATYITRLYQKVVNEDYKYVPLVCVYDLINDGTDTSNNEDNFGILHA